MAKLSLDQKLIEEILGAFASGGINPSAKLYAGLSKASGLFEGSLKQRYKELYQQVNDTDEDPDVPPAGFVG